MLRSGFRAKCFGEVDSVAVIFVPTASHHHRHASGRFGHACPRYVMNQNDRPPIILPANRFLKCVASAAMSPFRRYLPDDIVNRRKRGLSVPIGSWPRGPLKEWAATTLEK